MAKAIVVISPIGKFIIAILLGVDSAQAIPRFWALGLCLYQYLDSLRHRLERLNHRQVTMGEILAWLRQWHEELRINWICLLASKGVPTSLIQAVLAPALPPLSPANR